MLYDNIIDYDFPHDLRSMSIEEMNKLSQQIRDFLIEKVSEHGGHLASNLGVVELSIALHRYFKSPDDKIIWDVGHQSYVHKILTGRAKDFDSLRETDGMSGFPKMCESVHDVVDTGHSSTSISIAAGMAAARDLAGDHYSVVAVIGDGALTGGIAYEALNNLGASKSKVIVILNDNGMSISKNTGSVSQHLSTLRTSKGYQDFKSSVKNALKNTPGVYKGVEHIKDTVKYAFVEGALFEELGITYLGPVDGHNIEDVINALILARRVNGPVIIHTITKKGKGYAPAEQNPGKFHGIGKFDSDTGETFPPAKIRPSYSSIFGDKMMELAAHNQKVVAISAAMIEGTGLSRFAKAYPARMFDVGIAEEHAVSFAAGLARNGYIPIVAVYSTFLQRAYDNIMMDVCLNELPVIFAIDRAGCVGQDGQTHNGMFDLSYLSQMPNMTVLAPRDGLELEQMMDYAISLHRPVAIRYPRGSAKNFRELHDFDGHNYFIVNQQGKLSDVEIWASGKMSKIAAAACELLEERGICAALVNNCVIKPLQTELLDSAAERTKLIVTIEDNSLCGGVGQSISAYIYEHKLNVSVYNFGWPDRFIEHGNTEELFARYGLDSESIAERICELIERQTGCNTGK